MKNLENRHGLPAEEWAALLPLEKIFFNLCKDEEDASWSMLTSTLALSLLRQATEEWAKGGLHEATESNV